MKKHFAVLLIVFCVLASYAPAVRDGFVWDDTALVLRDPLIRSWRLVPEGFNHFLFIDATASDFYRPLQRLTYTFDYAAAEFRPAIYHVTSILCHVAAAIALLFFAGELLLALGVEERRRRMIALIATMAWAIHPVHSAAVIYISGRADPLAAAFGFLGFYLILRTLRADNRSGLLLVVGASVALLLSALSKETGLLFPVGAIVLLSLLKEWAAVRKTAVLTAFVGVVYLSLRFSAEHHPPPALGTPTPLTLRPIIVARAFAEYAGLIVLPLNLHMDREVDPRPSLDTNMSAAAWRELQTLAGICLMAGFVYWMIRARKRNPAAFTALILGAITYLPVSGIITLNASVAEHWIYLPSAFLFLAIGLEVANLLETRKFRRSARIAASIAFVAWFAFLGTRTFLRTFDWKDQRRFLERGIGSGGDSARMLINLGGLELSEGRFDLGKKHLQMALRKQPDQPAAIINLAAVALKQNDFKAARELLMRAIKMPLVEAQAHELLAVLENKENGRADVMRLRVAARTGPPNWLIERRYIKLLDETGATEAAVDELKKCLRNEWYRAESWQLLSYLLAKLRRSDEAANALARARAYDVHLAERANNP